MKDIMRIIFTVLLITAAVSGVFAQTAPDVKIDAAVSKGTDGGYIISVEYDIPEGFHQTLQESVFTFRNN